MQKHRGFSMLELCVALVVMTLLSAVSIDVVSTAQDASRRELYKRQVELAQAALFRFASKNARLPCPDLTGAGFEGDSSGNCPDDALYGALPFRSLDIEQPVLSAGDVLRYGVFRDPASADLSSPQASFAGLSSRARMAQLALAALGSSAPAQPYVPQQDPSDGSQSNCANTAPGAAFIVSVGVQKKLGSANCFAAPSAVEGASSAVSRLELAGWAAAQAK